MPAVFLRRTNVMSRSQTRFFFSSIRARPRLALCVASGLALYLVLPTDWRGTTRGLVAWCLAVSVYLALIGIMTLRSSVEDIQHRAIAYDQGKAMVLVLSVLAAFASFAAIVVELAQAKVGGRLGQFHLVLATSTVMLSWAFVHVMFALRYAHDYYSPEDGQISDALDFPGTKQPVYVDFLYFAFVIGCACATADVSIGSREIRMVAMTHGIIAFVFNTAIVALTINIAAGLLA
jgi:uncharacterized membrane protein